MIPEPEQWRPLLKALRLPPDDVRKVVLIFSVDDPVRVLADFYVSHDKLDAATETVIDIAHDCGAETIKE
jgi:hypothetical protein